MIKKIVDVYLEIEPLNKGNTASGHLRPIIHKEINRILDYLNSKREKDSKLQELLQKPENKDLLEALSSNLRF